MSQRQTNVDHVLQLLRSGPLSRANIADRAGLSRATVSSIVGQLIASGVAVDRGPDTGRRNGAGRPTLVVALSEHSVRSIGVDFRLNDVSVAIADPLHEVVDTARRRHRRGLNWARRAEIAIEEIDRLCSRHGIESLEPDGIGVGVPGPVSTEAAGPWRHATARLEQQYAASTHVENNLRLNAVAETTWGAGHGHDSVIYFHLEDGVGGGVVIGGRLFRGANGAAGEFGHATVPEADRVRTPCRCGKRGCLEQIAALPALLRSAGIRRDRQSVAELAVRPDLQAELRTAARLCGRTAGDAMIALDVSHVILGGIFAHAGEELIDIFTESAKERMLPTSADRLRVSRSRLSDDAGVRGGLALVQHSSNSDL